MSESPIATFPLEGAVSGTNDDVFRSNPSRGIDFPDAPLGRRNFFTEHSKTLGDEGDLILTICIQ